MIDKTTGIWDLETSLSRGGHKHDEGLVKTILELYQPPKRMADLGCGDGWYCKQFKDAGWNEVHGYEGCQEVKKFNIYDDIMIIDLSLKRYVDIYYDFVLCIEVGEHIPKEKEQVFFDNVREFCSRHLIYSHATPGQGGRGHLNERPQEYVNEQLTKRGFIENTDISKYLHEKATLKWLKRTVASYELR